MLAGPLVWIVAFGATAALAQPPALPTGTVDAAASRVYVLVDKSGLVGHVHAVEGRLVSGRIVLGASERAGTLVFDMRSFLADTPAARQMLGLNGQIDAATQQQTTANMLSPEVLDVGNHPTARFDIHSSLASAKSQPGAPSSYDLVGIFTLHGAQRPLTLTTDAEDRGAAVRLRGGFRVKQTDYGMKPYAKFGGMVGVANELAIWGDVWLPDGLPQPVSQPAVSPNNPNGEIQK